METLDFIRLGRLKVISNGIVELNGERIVDGRLKAGRLIGRLLD